MNDKATLTRDEQGAEASYYLSRAEQEDEAALNAANPLAADIHRNLAIRYRNKAYGFHAHLDARQKLSIVRD
jgi:hypothetical protein